MKSGTARNPNDSEVVNRSTAPFGRVAAIKARGTAMPKAMIWDRMISSRVTGRR